MEHPRPYPRPDGIARQSAAALYWQKRVRSCIDILGLVYGVFKPNHDNELLDLAYAYSKVHDRVIQVDPLLKYSDAPVTEFEESHGRDAMMAAMKAAGV